MMLFIVLAGAMVLLALLVILLPLLRGREIAGDTGASLAVLRDEMRALQAERDRAAISEAEFAAERSALERRALQAEQEATAQAALHARSNRSRHITAVVLALALPLAAVGLYRAVGTPAALDAARLQEQTSGNLHESNERAIAALEQRLAATPDDVSGWVLLARSYGQLGRLDDAVGAYKKAVVIDGENPDLLVEYADALAVSRDRVLEGEPERLIQHALQLNPEHAGALMFAGLAAFQRDAPQETLQYWQRLVDLLPPDSESRQRLQENMAAIVAQQGAGASDSEGATAGGTAANATITGTVTLAPELQAQVEEGDTLFVYARAAGGPPMPLAALRTRAADWPVAFVLDDSSAMLPERALSSASRVDLVARIALSGGATAQSGDLEGEVSNVAAGSQDVHIVIDRVRP